MVEFRCNISATKYGKYEWDRLFVDEMNEMGCGLKKNKNETWATSVNWKKWDETWATKLIM